MGPIDSDATTRIAEVPVVAGTTSGNIERDCGNWADLESQAGEVETEPEMACERGLKRMRDMIDGAQSRDRPVPGVVAAQRWVSARILAHRKNPYFLRMFGYRSPAMLCPVRDS